MRRFLGGQSDLVSVCIDGSISKYVSIADSFFKSLAISIPNYLPRYGNGYDLVDGVKVYNGKSIYVDPISGDLVINLINIKENEQVEVEILTAGNTFNDTIYQGSN